MQRFSMQWSLVLLLGIFNSALSAKNVLFFASDDMRPDINAYSGPDFPGPETPKMYTPNLDELASKSLLLKRAYVQQSVCSPSRTSLLTGRRPDTTHVTDLIHYWREVGGNFTTIPQYFKENGYTTVGMGKIFHPGAPSNYNDPISWTEPYLKDKNYYVDIHDTWTAFPDASLVDKPLQDIQIADHAVKSLRKYSKLDKPFFIAVGFRKPHLPFQFPESYLKYYPKDSIKVPSNPYAPVNMPPIAWSDFDEIRAYNDVLYKYGYGSINTTFFPDEKTKELRRAYYATISYVDAQLGRVLQEVKDLGLWNNTVISFWGDHGWQLGEHGEWCKHTNFELSTHAPMMVRVPGLTDSGPVTEQLTEFVDLFPTLADAAGLPPVPLCPNNSAKVELCTEGKSFVPLMEQPKRDWKSAAFSQYPRMDVAGSAVMGYTMRTDRYRYTEWVKYSGIPDYQPMWDNLFKGPSIELYDHQTDPDENRNVALDLEQKDLVASLSKQLHEGWRNALPEEEKAGGARETAKEGQGESLSYKRNVFEENRIRDRMDVKPDIL